jgi:uncharacterized protein (TIGR03067 family)
MTRFVTFVMLIAACATAAAQEKPAPIAKALVPLQGTWVLSSPDGQAMMPGGELALVITGDTYAQTVNGQVTERGTIKLDAAKKPMAIDLIITEGDDAGKTQLGVIEVTGDDMKGALNVPSDTTRPAGFAAQEGVIAFIGKRKAK